MRKYCASSMLRDPPRTASTPPPCAFRCDSYCAAGSALSPWVGHLRLQWRSVATVGRGIQHDRAVGGYCERSTASPGEATTFATAAWKLAGALTANGIASRAAQSANVVCIHPSSRPEPDPRVKRRPAYTGHSAIATAGRSCQNASTIGNDYGSYRTWR